MEPTDVDRATIERVSALCLGLPETTVHVDRWSHTFQIRRRVFTHLFAVDDGGRVSTLVSLRADPDECRALVAIGHPYFAIGHNRSGLGVVIDADIDWEELGELITESYRLLAPKKLAALLDDPEG